MFPHTSTDDGKLNLAFWKENSTISLPGQNRLQLLHFQSLAVFFDVAAVLVHHLPLHFSPFLVAVPTEPVGYQKTMPQDSHFYIHGDARCLENLLALNGDLTGTSFLSHLWDDKAFWNPGFLKRQKFMLGCLLGYWKAGIFTKIPGITVSLLKKLFDV